MASRVELNSSRPSGYTFPVFCPNNPKHSNRPISEALCGKTGQGGMAVCLDELTECVGDGEGFAEKIELKELLNAFLKKTEPRPREIFMLRYWHMLSIKEIAARYTISENAVKMSLKRTRDSLRKFLLLEGYEV